MATAVYTILRVLKSYNFHEVLFLSGKEQNQNGYQHTRAFCFEKEKV